MNSPQATTAKIQFDDGAAYENYMGKWSQLVGQAFLKWLAPSKNRDWLDVGCGNGAFTKIIIENCAPKSIHGIDPSDAQLAFATSRSDTAIAKFQRGNAMALPFSEKLFDIAIMPLVIFFLPEPKKGVAEMTRVVRAGGNVAAYGWDINGGGFPYQPLQDEMRAMNIPYGQTPHPEAAQLENMRTNWSANGLTNIRTTEIRVERTFASFNEFWATVLKGPSVGPALSALAPDQTAQLQEKIKKRLSFDAKGRLTMGGRANAIVGSVPK